MVLDEGMAVIRDIVPGLGREAAMIGIAEKGYMSLALEVRAQGGHSSTPPPRTAVNIPRSRANVTAWLTSSLDKHRAISAGRLSCMPFQSMRALSYSG